MTKQGVAWESPLTFHRVHTRTSQFCHDELFISPVSSLVTIGMTVNVCYSFVLPLLPPQESFGRVSRGGYECENSHFLDWVFGWQWG